MSFLCDLADTLCPERRQDIATLLATNLELMNTLYKVKNDLAFALKENRRLMRVNFYLRCELETEHDYSGSPCDDDWKEQL